MTGPSKAANDIFWYYNAPCLLWGKSVPASQYVMHGAFGDEFLQLPNQREIEVMAYDLFKEGEFIGIEGYYPPEVGELFGPSHPKAFTVLFRRDAPYEARRYFLDWLQTKVAVITPVELMH